MSKKLTGDFRKFMDKNFIGSWDIPDDNDLILTIDHAEQEEVKNDRGTETKLTVHFVEDYKPMICNTTNSQAISKVAGSTKVERWENCKIALYTERVKAFGTVTDAVRVRDYAPKTDEIICTDCGSVIEGSGKYSAKVIAERAKSKYGTYLCMDCAMKRSGAERSEAEEGEADE